MIWINFVLVILINFSIIDNGVLSVSKFYEDIYSHEYSCSAKFGQPLNIDCACITGFWIIYDSCSENITLAGDETVRCVRLSGAPITKAVQVLSNREELAVVTQTGTVTKLTQERPSRIEVYQDMAMITGSDWTLIDITGARICLSVIEPDSYCFFSKKETSYWEIENVEKGCEQFDYFLDPSKCDHIVGDEENICEIMEEYPSHHRIVKRDAAAAATTAAPSGKKGMSDSGNSSEIPEEDEYYRIMNSTSKANGTDPSDIIADGIIDFIDTILDSPLGFNDTQEEVVDGHTTTVAPDMATPAPKDNTGVRKKKNAEEDEMDEEEYTNATNPNPLNVTYFNPVYEFLEISKRITQKTCPSFYVKPTFLELAVSTFIRLQQVQFKFPESSFKPAAYRRVLHFLRKCETFASQFNFTDANCDGKVDGNYTAYGQTIELTVTAEYANFNRDPIIETVWKVFFNAHSYCYPLFHKTLDHHRFTTWMIPLFQNQVNDLWVAGNTTEESLNGLFGNQVQIQGNLAYCAVSSRLESNYPWDLPRPTRVPEFGPSLTGNSTGNGTTGRRKRDVDYMNLISLKNNGNCLDLSQPMLCPDHVKSIVSQ